MLAALDHLAELPQLDSVPADQADDLVEIDVGLLVAHIEQRTCPSCRRCGLSRVALRSAFAAIAWAQASNRLRMRASRALADGKEWHQAGLAPAAAGRRLRRPVPWRW
jgi:hypothetical protein